jgi:uridylate kinase
MKDGPSGFHRVLLKMSGDGLCREEGTGIDPGEVGIVAREIKRVSDLGREIAVVCGGGNILRGSRLGSWKIDRVSADQMGMLATVINAMALQETLQTMGVEARTLTAMGIEGIAERYTRNRCVEHLAAGRVVILSGGTGNPYFTTDTAAAVRAAEIKADVLLKATKVDGVYSDDPKKNPEARFYRSLSYMDVLTNRLGIMDAAAVSICLENRIPIVVFNLKVAGNIEKAVLGEETGTLITHSMRGAT